MAGTLVAEVDYEKIDARSKFWGLYAFSHSAQSFGTFDRVPVNLR
jgi:hypothetical protein